MRKSLTLFALLMLAYVCPAAAQVVIDEITIQSAESYTVNEEMVVRFKVNNNTGVPLAAEDYSLSVNVGGVYAGKPEATKAIANGSYESFMAKVAPHKAGENLPVEIVFKGMGTFTETAPTTITVNPEVYSASKTIGERNACESQHVLYPYYNYSQSETVYTADLLKLAEGTKITNLTFKGYKESPHSIPLKVWVELTDDTAPVSSGTNFINTESMTVAFNGNYNLPQAGEGYASYDEHGEILSINLSTPIEYVAGKSLRVVVEASKGITYKTCYLECDKNITGKSVLRYSDTSRKAGDGSGVEDKSFESKTLPVLYLGIEKEAPTVSGQVYVITKNNQVAYPQNATVALTNGNIMYFAQTDEDGNYNMTVYKDQLTYDVTVEPEDYVIFPYKETLALNGSSVTKNIELKEAAGAYILSAEFPETGVENNPVTVTANIQNYDATEMDDTNAKIILKLDGEQVAEVAADDLHIDAFDNDNFTLTFTPHVSGEKELTVEVYINGVLQHSKSGNITISKESATNDFTIKGSENSANETTSPIRLYSTHSYSQTLLTSDMLSGLAAGSKITGLKLESAQTKNTKNFNFDVKVWVMNTEDGVDNITTDPHSSDFKQVYSATLVQRYHGYYNDGSVTYEKFFDLVFDEPFIYEGKNIRIAMRADIQGDGYQQTYFKALKDVKTSYHKSSDNPKIDGVAVDIMDYTWASVASLTPVFTFVVDNASIVTGTVVNKDTQAPVANAEVKLTANDGADIIYTAKTDAEGKFEISVIQANHSFTASASASGYKAVENAGSISADFDSPFDLGTIELETYGEGTIVSIDPTIGFATFYDSEHAVKIPEGVVVYGVNQVDSDDDEFDVDKVEYSLLATYSDEVYNNVVPAGEAIVIKADADVPLEYTEDPGFESGTLSNYGTNLLTGSDDEVETEVFELWNIFFEDEFPNGLTTDDCYFYGFSLDANNDPTKAGFYWMNETGAPFTSKAHKAYLCIPKFMFPTNDDAKIAFLFNDDATGIKNVNVVNRNSNMMFNLAGQRVNKNAKGIIIKNGKKMLVK